ncbi:LuxR family transcriptional regulator [Streptomyces sp. NBS 14/10]|uniref:ATP-binding protein n=1 Tax=Streptomyces sp. NBS 14/10 TaxID=1945643 RepID=UPI00117FBF25|nr:LuxR family transcriptional regulator [Streptomyces sp. NBS 14/10]KAK1177558.1 LuxR family transcriptional regulator [Streptomyces sp. NBS 14/10]
MRHLSRMVGRANELTEARRLLGRTRLLTLTGVAGVGKSRLALGVADLVRGDFPDGVWTAELTALEDPSLLPQTVASAVGLRDQAARPAVEVLGDHLRDKRALLLLDNCEHLIEPCALLADRLLRRAPRLCLLVTSREPLRVEGEAVLWVPSLPVPEPHRRHSPQTLARYPAVQLFVARAARVSPSFTLDAHNGDAVALLCGRLDGLPLAIELAAVGLRTLSPDQVLDQLDQWLEPVAGESAAGERTAGEAGATRARHQSLGAAVDWSFDLCSPAERTLWARVSVFAGDFGLPAAEEVCAGDGVEREDVLDLVAGLVDKSILVREDRGDEVRYRLLETIRRYGRARLAGYGQVAALRRRHRDWYRALVREAEGQWLTARQEEWLTRLRGELANLRTALEFCCAEPGEARAGLEIAAGLWPHWICGGSLAEGRHWLEQALWLAPEDSVARGTALWVDAWLAALQGDTASALPRLDECRELALRLGHEPTLVRATQHRGALALYEGDFPRAIRLIEKALEGHRAARDRNGMMTALYQLTMACALSGDARAAVYGEECLALCEAAEAQWARSYALWALGLHTWHSGDRRRATALVRDALRTRWVVRDGWGMALCLEVLAWTAAFGGQPGHGARLMGAADAMWSSMGTSPSGFRHLAAVHDEVATRLRTDLGTRAYAAAYRAGARLTADEAAATALHDPPRLHPHGRRAASAGA